VTIGPEGSSTQLDLVTFDSNGHITGTNATTLTYGSPYLLRVATTNAAGTSCAPNPVGESACPTGTVILTDNGNPLDAGTYSLNSNGYLEDQHIQLSGGSHVLQARFSGDNSFAPSDSAPVTVTVQQAFAGADFFTPNGSPLRNALAGSTVTLQVVVDPVGDGLPPSGTVAFFLGNLVLGN
jgi:hypothetical protein